MRDSADFSDWAQTLVTCWAEQNQTMASAPPAPHLLESSPMAMEDMRAVLRRSLGRSLDAFDEADRLAAAWPVAGGKAMAAHGEVAGFFEGTVTVAVSDPAWLSQMMSMRSALANEMARIARVKVTAIHFELKKR